MRRGQGRRRVSQGYAFHQEIRVDRVSVGAVRRLSEDHNVQKGIRKQGRWIGECRTRTGICSESQVCSKAGGL